MPLRALSGKRLSLPAHFAAFRAAKPRQQPQQRGFTCAVRPFDLNYIAVINRETEIAEQYAFIAYAGQIGGFQHERKMSHY